jgi:hypothetical protein
MSSKPLFEVTIFDGRVRVKYLAIAGFREIFEARISGI